MSGNGQSGQPPAGSAKVEWSGGVLSAEDVRARLNGQPEIVLRANTVITPSALDELRHRGIRITRQTSDSKQTVVGRWLYAQDRSYPLVSAVTQALKHEGLGLEEVQVDNQRLACRWAQTLAQRVQRSDCRGIFAFCEDAGIACCV